MDAEYENRRENLWKDASYYDPKEHLYTEDGEKIHIRGNNISFFQPKGKVPIKWNTNIQYKQPVATYDVSCNVSDVITWLNAKCAKSSLWKPYELGVYGALILYIKQCEDEGAKKCLLSKREFAMIFPKSKKRKRK